MMAAIGRMLPAPQTSTLTESVAAVAAATNTLPAASHATATGTPLYEVAYVVDGDTIDVRMGTSTVRIRLIGLDTPELVDPRKPVQCFAKEASARAKELLVGQLVRIEEDASQGARDKYGRLLAYIFLQNGANFNELMIAEGYGHEYTYRLPYAYQAAFKAAEKDARETKRGLWADAPDGGCAGSTAKPAT